MLIDDKIAKFMLLGVTCQGCKNYSVIVENETYELKAAGFNSRGEVSYTGYAKLTGVCKLKGKVDRGGICESWT